jgi:hypothetical protein
MSFQELALSMDTLVEKQPNKKVLLIKDNMPAISLDGKNSFPLEHGIIAGDIQMDLIKKFEGGIVSDEKFYIYLLQKVDPSKVDYTKYAVIN